MRAISRSDINVQPCRKHRCVADIILQDFLIDCAAITFKRSRKPTVQLSFAMSYTQKWPALGEVRQCLFKYRMPRLKKWRKEKNVPRDEVQNTLLPARRNEVILEVQRRATSRSAMTYFLISHNMYFTCKYKNVPVEKLILLENRPKLTSSTITK